MRRNEQGQTKRSNEARANCARKLTLSTCSAFADSSRFKSQTRFKVMGRFLSNDSIGRIGSSSPALGERPTYRGGRDQRQAPRHRRRLARETMAGLHCRPGFCATVFADNVGHARHMVVAPNGVVYVNTWSGRYYANTENAKAPGRFPAGAAGHDRQRPLPTRSFASARESRAAMPAGRESALYNGALFAETNDRIVRYALPPGAIAPTGRARGRRFGAAADRRPSHASVQDRCAGRPVRRPRLRHQCLPAAEPNSEFSGHPAVHGARDAGRYLAL